MAQVVNANLGELRAIPESVVFAQHVPGIEHRANAGRENHAGLVPRAATQLPLLLLASAMSKHLFEYDLRQPEASLTLLALCREQFRVAPLLPWPLDSLQRSDQIDLAVPKIDVCPLQSEQLAFARPNAQSLPEAPPADPRRWLPYARAMLVGIGASQRTDSPTGPAPRARGV